MNVIFVDLKLYKDSENNAIGYKMNCFSTTVVKDFTAQV